MTTSVECRNCAQQKKKSEQLLVQAYTAVKGIAYFCGDCKNVWDVRVSYEENKKISDRD